MSSDDHVIRTSLRPRTVLAVALVLLCWLLMQVVHETGHWIGAVATGGRVLRMVLVPWEFSRTDLAENPQPLIVSWAGPLLGVAIPILALCVATIWRWQFASWLRFFAGFCLVANGAYISYGSWAKVGDANDMLREGCPEWPMLLFGLITVPVGLALWHRQGHHFGLGPDATPIRWSTAGVAVGLLFVIIAAELLGWALAARNFPTFVNR